MKFPHYGKPSKQSRKSEKSGADSAERTIRTSSKAESFAKSAEKNWFVIGKVMVRCIFTVHLAIHIGGFIQEFRSYYFFSVLRSKNLENR